MGRHSPQLIIGQSIGLRRSNLRNKEIMLFGHSTGYTNIDTLLIRLIEVMLIQGFVGRVNRGAQRRSNAG